MFGRGCYHSAPKELWGRRDFVKVGSLGLLGLNLADFFRLRTAAAADGFAIFPAGDRDHDPGEIVGFLPTR